jgi:23S rRNA (cytidine1920-2'-O)/16S rRNA (cytidine1409-2'-O)-methyltransferase
MKVEKTRLDILLAQRGLAESRSLAQKLIMAGDVRVDGQVVADPSRKVAADALLALEKGPRFVSRGGEKLEPALLDFGLTDLTGWVCADVGASTGGFTDCLLQHGALKVYAIDVGYGILHWKMRSDPRVVVMERTNARHVESLPEIPALVTVDASFISLRILLPVIRAWFGPQGQAGQVVALIKPQFEAGKEAVDRGEGVIHDPRIHRQVLEEVLAFAQEQRFAVRGLVKSSLKGPKGNTEFLVHLGLSDEKTPGFDQGLIDRALA